MTQDARISEAMNRIDAALGRIEAAATRQESDGDLARRHAALRDTVSNTLGELDRLIGQLET